MTEYVLAPSPPNACGVSESFRVYKADVKVDALTIYQKVGSQCVTWLTFQSPSDADVFLLADENDPGEFVGAWR